MLLTLKGAEGIDDILVYFGVKFAKIFMFV